MTQLQIGKGLYVSEKNDDVVLEFDQAMAWNNAVAIHHYLDGTEGKIASGVACGKVVTPDAVKAPRR